MKPARIKKPTWTSVVVDTLRIMDDFLSARQLCDLTGGTPSQISATIHHLQAKHVIDAVLVQGEPFWFLTGRDDRVMSKDEIADTSGRKPKGGYASPKKNRYYVKPRQG